MRFADHDLPEQEHSAVQQHLALCSTCNEIVRERAADLAATEVQSTADFAKQQSTIEDTTRSGRDHLLAEIQVGQTLGDFCLVQHLGSGSFAKVFLARQESLQWLVALKVTRRKTDEAPALARLDHEHIVRIHGQYVLPREKLLLVSTKYIPGGTVENVIRQIPYRRSPPGSGNDLLNVIDGILETCGAAKPTASAYRQQLVTLDWPKTVCWVGAKLASALAHAHQRDVLHRDIKPANVLLTAEGSPMLVDFNISFSTELEGADAAAYFGGSLLYMSPEQLEACHPRHDRTPDQLDHRSDIYSLGLVLWELLTGKHPFQDAIKKQRGDVVDSLLECSLQPELPAESLDQLPRDCPPGLRQALLKCLAPDVSKRFSRAGQLAGALQKQLVPGLHELQVPRGDRWRDWVYRHPLVAIVLTVLLPNLVLAPINIALNVRGIIDQVGVDELLPSERAAFYEHLMPAINAVTWPLPAVLLIAYGWPMLRAVRDRRESGRADPQQWARNGHRTLRLGLACAVVIFVAWLMTGVAFPLGIDLVQPGGNLDGSHYRQFIVSQFMHALVAAAVTYFLVTYLCVRALYPRLIPDEPPATDAQDDLVRVRRWGGVFAVALGISPLLAIVALATIFWNKSAELRFVFVWLAVLGELGFLLAWMIAEKLKPVLDTLAAAVQSNEEFFQEGTK